MGKRKFTSVVLLSATILLGVILSPSMVSADKKEGSSDVKEVLVVNGENALTLRTDQNKVPPLPEKVLLAGIETEVTWEQTTAADFSEIYQRVIVRGTAGASALSAEVWVMPADLVYLMDTGRVNGAASDIFNAGRSLFGRQLLNDSADRKITTDTDNWGYVERNPNTDQRVSVTAGNSEDWASSFTGDDNDEDEGLVYRMTLEPGVYQLTAAHVPRRNNSFASWLNIDSVKVDSKTVKTTTSSDGIHPPIYVTHEFTIPQSMAISYETQKSASVYNAHVSLIAVRQFEKKIAAPTISLAAGDFWQAQKTTLSSPDELAEIRYTIDGTEPTGESTLYDGTEIEIAHSSELKAAAFKDGKMSEVISRVYTIRQWAPTATEFKLYGQDEVNNVKLSWERRTDADSYDIFRNGKLLGSTKGEEFDDYGLALDTSYSYRLVARRSGEVVEESIPVAVTTFVSKSDGPVFDNYNGQTENAVKGTKGLLIGDRYYHYSMLTETRTIDGSDVSCKVIYEECSSDGKTGWSPRRELAVYPNCKLEGVGFLQHPVTGKVIMAAHYEDAEGYTAGKHLLAEIEPGGQLRETHVGRPLGHDSRDQSVFVDDDNTAYLLSSTRGNNDINIYRLSDDWTEPVELVNTVFIGQHRETPMIIKKDGIYYFFSSKTAGWYPSQAMYSSTKDLTGVWAPLRELGNNSSTATQVNGLGTYSGTIRDAYGVWGTHWGAQWSVKDPAGTFSRVHALSFNAGIATMDYFRYMETSAEYGCIPVQMGKNISTGKQVTVSSADSVNGDAARITDGADTASSGYFKAGSYPYDFTIDLEDVYRINEVVLSTRLYNGSESAYKYTVDASTDGKAWTTLVDQSENTSLVGFYMTSLEDETYYRYVRVNILGLTNVHNGNGNSWADGIYEFTVFGSEQSKVDKSVLQAFYDEVKDTKQKGWETAGWVIFAEALKEAAAQLTNDQALQAEVDLAYENLRTAFSGLVEAKEDAEAIITVTGAQLRTLKQGKSLQLSAEVDSAVYSEADVIWSSGNARVLSVSAEGLVQGLQAGTTKVTATLPNDKEYSITIRITR